jgi:4-hydroxybenzoate polyprenyltransferase
LALMLPWAFLFSLVVCFGFSMSYSLFLKRKLMVDVVALAALYGIRGLAAATATGILLSHWLVGFCFFIFLSLALVKRASELIAMPPASVGNIKRPAIVRRSLDHNAARAASGFVAILVFALYINSPEVAALYRNPEPRCQ